MSTSVYCFVVGKSGCVLSLLLSATHVHSLIDYISANRDDIMGYSMTLYFVFRGCKDGM
jgi:hypothetical protein